VQNSYQKLASNRVKFSSNDYSTLTESYLTNTVLLNTQRVVSNDISTLNQRSTRRRRIKFLSNDTSTVDQRLSANVRKELSLHYV
jgi:hypothetical protein